MRIVVCHDEHVDFTQYDYNKTDPVFEEGFFLIHFISKEMCVDYRKNCTDLVCQTKSNKEYLYNIC